MNTSTDKSERISGGVFSRQTGVFLIFLALSAVLWLLTSLGDETQRKIEYTVEVTGMPDDVKFATPLPKTVTVMVRGTGIRLLPTLWQDNPVIKVDYKTFVNGNSLRVSKRQLVDLVVDASGGKLEVVAVTPDTLCARLAAADF